MKQTLLNWALALRVLWNFFFGKRNNFMTSPNIFSSIFQFSHYAKITGVKFLNNNSASSRLWVPESSAQTTYDLWGHGEVICGCSVEPVPFVALPFKNVGNRLSPFFPLSCFFFFFPPHCIYFHREPSGTKFQECYGSARFHIDVSGFITKATLLIMLFIVAP